jgi:ATP-dependent exoDNAse (exonuclease V) alpha subunit
LNQTLLLMQLSCDLIEQSNEFLANELKKESEAAIRHKRINIQVVDCIRRDDFYYATLQPNEQLFFLEEVTWVQILGEGHSQYGSLWLADENRPYLLLNQEIAKGTITIIEADGIKLLEMQKKALETVVQAANEHSQAIRGIITNDRKQITPHMNFHGPTAFYSKQVEFEESQNKAVKKALEKMVEGTFFLIHGPPGTGKTTVITEIVRQLVKEGKRVLITSHTNVAVDNVLENLLPYFLTKMVRLGSKVKSSNNLRALIPKASDELIKLSSSQIVGATLSKLSVLVLNEKLSFEKPSFDIAIIDESSMATIPLTLCGVLLAKSFILVGDHKQLPPIVKTKMPPYCNSMISCGKKCESLFMLLINLYPQESQMLELQFRSHPLIAGFSSQKFYENRIRSSYECLDKKITLDSNIQTALIKGVTNQNPLCYINMNYDIMPYDNPVEWFPPRDFSHEKQVQPSCLNRYEAAIALKARNDLIKAGLPSERIWIITPYRLQREIIRRAIRKIYGSAAKDATISLSENVTASTVDSIQGKENDVVIYVLTWTPKYGREHQIHAALCDHRRLNVAMTRAKKKLIIIGDLSKLSYQYPYSALEGYLGKNAEIIQAPRLSENDDFLKVVTRCYDEKRKVINPTLIAEAKDAKRRIQEELELKQPETIFLIYNDPTFDTFRSSSEWEDLTFQDKQRCYELRRRKTTFQVRTNFDKTTKRKIIAIVETKAWEMPGNSHDKEELEQPNKTKTDSKPTLITTQDFTECGKVANYLKINPNAKDNEIASIVRLPIRRVSELRIHLEQNGLYPQQTNTATNPKITSTQLTNSSMNSRNEELIKCPYCVTSIAKDFLESHIRKEHTSKTKSMPEIATPPLHNTTGDHIETASIEKCDNCATKISSDEYERHDGLCTNCYYHKLSGTATRNERNAGVLGKDRTY